MGAGRRGVGAAAAGGAQAGPQPEVAVGAAGDCHVLCRVVRQARDGAPVRVVHLGVEAVERPQALARSASRPVPELEGGLGAAVWACAGQERR